MKTLITLIMLVVVYSLLLGRPQKGKWIKRSIGTVLLIVFLIMIVRGMLYRAIWMPNAGGGMAIDQNAEIELEGSDHPIFIPVTENDCEEFDHSLEHYLKATSSDVYSPQLSHLLIALCNAVGDKGRIDEAFRSMGFELNNGSSNDDLNLFSLIYYTATKSLSDDSQIVLVVIRGSSSPNDNIYEWLPVDIGGDNIGNLNINPNHDRHHSAFADLADTVYKSVLSAAEASGDLSKTVFVLTGHSRGAATANLVAAKLIDQRISKKNVYCYSFACPDTGYLSKDEAASYNCIFNINHENDLVSWVPWLFVRDSGAYYHFPADTYWDKYGNSYWFSMNDWEDCHLEFNFEYIPKNHLQDLYLEYLRTEPNLSAFKEKGDAVSILKW